MSATTSFCGFARGVIWRTLFLKHVKCMHFSIAEGAYLEALQGERKESHDL